MCFFHWWMFTCYGVYEHFYVYLCMHVPDRVLMCMWKGRCEWEHLSVYIWVPMWVNVCTCLCDWMNVWARLYESIDVCIRCVYVFEYICDHVHLSEWKSISIFVWMSDNVCKCEFVYMCNLSLCSSEWTVNMLIWVNECVSMCTYVHFESKSVKVNLYICVCLKVC